MNCSFQKESLYFIKNVIKKDKTSLFEIAKLKVKSKKVKIITDLKNATNIISMDKKLLTLKDGEYYLVEGQNDLTSKEFLSK